MAYSGKRRSECFGEEELRESVKAPRVWVAEDEQDGDCITSVNFKGGGTFQQRAIASAMALQDIGCVNQSRQSVFHDQTQAQGAVRHAHVQAQPLNQSSSPSVSEGHVAKLSAQQQQKLQLQQQKMQLQLLQQQLQQQQQQQQQKMQLIHLQQQQMKQEVIQQQQVKQEQMQQQQVKLDQLQQLLQQDQVQQDHLHWLKEQNLGFGSTVCLPSNVKTCRQIFGDWDIQAALSSAPPCSYPVENSCISRPQSSSSLVSDAGNDQASSIVSNTHSEAQHPPGSSAVPSAFLQDLQNGPSFFHLSPKDSTSADPQLLAPCSLSGGFDAASIPGCLFSSNMNEHADQVAVMQHSALYRSMHELQQGQPDVLLPTRQLSAGGSMMPSVMMPMMGGDTNGVVNRMPNQLVTQNQAVYGKQPVIGNYSVTAPDLPVNQKVVTGNCVNDPGVQLQTTAAPPRRPITRTYTKVIKLGSIGRAVDVNRFKNYTELRCELARMFGLEGQLDRESGWHLVFVDNENDLLLVGDDPWEEFVTSVRGIRILSPAEVAYFMNSDDRAGPPYNCPSSSLPTRI